MTPGSGPITGRPPTGCRSVGAAYTLIDAGSAKVNQSGGPLRGDLAGEYDPNIIHAFNVNFVYRF